MPGTPSVDGGEASGLQLWGVMSHLPLGSGCKVPTTPQGIGHVWIG